MGLYRSSTSLVGMGTNAWSSNNSYVRWTSIMQVITSFRFTEMSRNCNFTSLSESFSSL